MKLTLSYLSLIVLLGVEQPSQRVLAQTLENSTVPLIRESCMACHDDNTSTSLNLQSVTFDLQSSENFRRWEKIYSRIANGEMPPPSEPRPDKQRLQTALDSLYSHLLSANLQKQRLHGRVPVRRLTRTEYNHTIRDLLKVQGEFSSLLPEETQAGSFDNVGSEQHFSAMHLESYLSAADVAMDAAIRLHKNPFRQHKYDLLNSEFLNSFHEKDIQVGGNISRRLDDGVVIFRDVDYLLRSDLHGFRVRSNGSGLYKISIKAESFQSAAPVAMKLVVKDISGQSELIQAYDLIPGQQYSLNANVYLQRSKVFYVSMAEERSPASILADIYDAGGAASYKGAGVLVKAIEVEGPIESDWPPPSTTSLLTDTLCRAADDRAYTIQYSKDPLLDVQGAVAKFAPRAFRRPLFDGELAAFTDLAKPGIAAHKDFEEVIRLPLRAILTSPQFLFLSGKSGRLNDYDLASRLSYFLWKTLPDEQLLQLASRSELSRPELLKQQIDRMLLDDRSQRFVVDFIGQWLGLSEINATTPDERLYPEYDEILHWSVARETQAFFSHVVAHDLPIGNLIDSDFVFVNRRLAEHYAIEGVTGQTLRKVELPVGSVRGGLLTQASVLKVTANGLVTSPVNRGAFVLTDLLGTPPPPPPSNVGSIEPDTSGATTIRETLQRHRSVESCAACHKLIDPPGFALECFDPIGGYRTHYRKRYDDFLNFVKYEAGPEVETHSTTAAGSPLNGLPDLKKSLLQQQQQIARHLVSQLVVYATGGEIEFADRSEIEAIVERTAAAGFPVKTLIHEIVLSKLFLNR